MKRTKDQSNTQGLGRALRLQVYDHSSAKSKQKVLPNASRTNCEPCRGTRPIRFQELDDPIIRIYPKHARDEPQTAEKGARFPFGRRRQLGSPSWDRAVQLGRFPKRLWLIRRVNLDEPTVCLHLTSCVEEGGGKYRRLVRPRFRWLDFDRGDIDARWNRLGRGCPLTRRRYRVSSCCSPCGQRCFSHGGAWRRGFVRREQGRRCDGHPCLTCE